MDHSLVSGCVQIWQLNLSEQEKWLGKLSEMLSEDEKTRALRFRFQSDQNHFIISRGILRILLGRYLDISPQDIVLQYTEFGKPYQNLIPKIRFNISHAGDYAIFGFAKDMELGVDIERQNPKIKVMEIAKNFFSAAEVAALREFPQEDRICAFYRCWTRKEAIIKALGDGLQCPLDSFTVSMAPDQEAKLLHAVWEKNETTAWELFSFVPAKEYSAAIAVRGKVRELKHMDWDPGMIQ